MNEFLKFIKEYLDEKFRNDTDISKKVIIDNAYKINNEITTANSPQIQIQIIDNSEVEKYSSFEGENVSSIPLQIIAYAPQMKIGNVMKSSQDVALIFGEKLKKYINALRESNVNKNIQRCRIITMAPALPLLDGSKIYTTAIRCEFWIANPYITG